MTGDAVVNQELERKYEAVAYAAQSNALSHPRHLATVQSNSRAARSLRSGRRSASMPVGGSAGRSCRAAFLLARDERGGSSWTVSCRARLSAALQGRHSIVPCGVAVPQMVQFIARAYLRSMLMSY